MIVGQVVVASPFIGQSGHRLLEFGIFALAVTLVILVPYVIDLLKGTATSGLARATMANAIVVVISLTVALLVIEKPFGKADPNQGLARLVLVALTTTLASVVAFYFGGKIATDAAAQAASTTGAGPAITITTPAEGATYTVGANVVADYSCTSPSGTATCTGKIVGGPDVANGDPLPVTAAGVFVFEVTAVDGSGATNTVRVKYTVS
jgi:hypothetical protein